MLFALPGCAGGLAAIGFAATPPPAWPVTGGHVPKDAALEARIRALASALALEQEAAQMVQHDIRSVTPDEVRRHHVGIVLAAYPYGYVAELPISTPR